MWLIQSDLTGAAERVDSHGATSVSRGGAGAAAPMLTNAKNMAKTANVVTHESSLSLARDALARVRTNHSFAG